jgi:DnaJ family protein C protein 27
MSATAGSSAESAGVLRLKVVSFGDANVGKSCLIKRFCENKFVAKYVATIGVDYGVKPVKIKEREVRVNFFDLSGLEAYTEIRNEFYKDSSAVRIPTIQAHVIVPFTTVLIMLAGVFGVFHGQS